MTFARSHSVTLTAIHRQVLPSLPLFSSVLQAVQAWGWHLAGREEKPALTHCLVRSPGTRIRCLSGEMEENKRHSTQSEWPL